MNRRDQHAIRQSWAQVQALGPDAGVLFYDQLFSLEPSLKPLFKGDPLQQSARLLQMMDFAILRIDRLDELKGPLRALGQRHVGYGVRSEHYPIVGLALLRTLRLALGSAFDARLSQAWARLYWTLAEAMRQGLIETEHINLDGDALPLALP